MFEYFQKQRKIYPKRVWGKYRKLKWLVMIITLGIYYATPFLRWDRGPDLPDQAVLIDLPNRKAYWFFIEIWPQEIYIIAGILIISALILFFITSLFGRIWCGYFCPQTVWTDLFVWVERIIQGDRNSRKKLHEGPVTWEKIYKIFITHVLWILIAWSTAGSFVLYFNDAPSLVKNFLNLQVSPTVLYFIIGLTFSTYLMAGYAREQVCTYMCPYARFQSAMFDRDTLIIGYDEKKGEPRGKHKAGTSWENRGHCIDCTACVQVCPVGIDIRNGLQMECIACGLCIDACNNIMDKLELPRGLIRYDTTKHMSSGTHGSESFRFVRPRTLYYLIVIGLVLFSMMYSLFSRPLTELHVLHERNPLFVQLSNGDIRNSYTLHILNKTHYRQEYDVSVEGVDGLVLQIKAAGVDNGRKVSANPDDVASYTILVTGNVTPSDPRAIIFRLKGLGDNKLSASYESMFITEK